MLKPTPRKLSTVLDDAINNLDGESISFEQLMQQLGFRAYGILLVLLTLPNAIPISGILGISALTGLLMMIFSIQMVFAVEKPWLPKFISSRKIEKSLLLKSLNAVLPFLKKVEPYIKPRVGIMSSSLAMRIIGFTIAGFCMVILLPIPFSNFVPALAILIVGLGMLEKDGIFIVAGMILGSAYCIGFIWLMLELIQKLLQ